MNQLRAHMKLLTAAAGVGRLAGLAGPGYRAAVPRRCGGRRVLLATGVAALLAAGIPGACQSVALASSYSILNWTKQHPAASPLARWDAPMAYDAAAGNVILFGGEHGTGNVLRDTWVWNGTTWAKQAPATSPPARAEAVMAYDAATGNVVLFGGSGAHGHFRDTWVWNGTTWAKRAPATSPPALAGAAMAYDAATRNVVLFGGLGGVTVNGTWTWDGATWAKQAPATSPPALLGASMAYDAATGNVVLFGGAINLRD